MNLVERLRDKGLAFSMFDRDIAADRIEALEAALQAIYSRIEPGKHNPVKGGAKDVRAIALAALKEKDQ